MIWWIKLGDEILFTTADGLQMPFGDAPSQAPILPPSPKIAPSFELFVFENRHNEICVRLSMGNVVRCPVTLSAGEALGLVRLMGAISRRCETWSERPARE